MARLIESSTRIEAAGDKPKLIDEAVGRVNSATGDLSIAHMRSPAGWVEPAQRPEFHEYTYVLAGLLRVETDGGTIDVRPGQTVVTEPGERVRYSTPLDGGAEYIAVCRPAFSADTVHREEDG
ncbi:MAG: cupin domain-containing protein [Myxococcales bacterium]|jgi:quercetin dioxygenase-like cupin family protein|nr:MAG: cupin domain-containing protein [Myxococcales bacterium]